MTSLLILVCFTIISAFAAIPGSATHEAVRISTSVPTPTPSETPEGLYRSYRGVSVRTPASVVTEKLGTPTQHSRAGDYYTISATESVQISYDADQTVKSITVNLTGDLKGAPTPKDVVGSDVKKDADGTISKMVSFPKDGYWVSYTRTGGKDATIIITLQKLAAQ